MTANLKFEQILDSAFLLLLEYFDRDTQIHY